LTLEEKISKINSENLFSIWNPNTLLNQSNPYQNLEKSNQNKIT